MKLYCYSKCSTCKKAIDFIHTRTQDVEIYDYTIDRLSTEDLRTLWQKSGKELKVFFNTSGLKYRELDLKNKRVLLDEAEQLQLLADNPMLVKRPILVLETAVLVGFKQSEWEAYL